VAIVGRPNVGKSTLFNVLARRRRAIVSAVPGTTRDRVSAVLTAERPDGREVLFELVDTGGVGLVDRPAIASEVASQIDRAIAEADAIVFVLDARAGLVPMDREIADRLRRLSKPIVVVASKCETEAQELEAANFQQLGLGEVIPISAEGRRNLDVLRSRLAEVLPELPPPGPAPEELPPRLAVVGRQNAGKSTFVNALAGDARVVVSEIPGTTRDPVDVRIALDGKPVVLVDTAGVLRRREGRTAPDHFSLSASRRTIERAEAVLLLVDAREPAGAVERELARVVNDCYRPCAIVVNKWDLVGSTGLIEDFEKYLSDRIPSLAHAPIVFVSALKGERVVDAARLGVELAMTARKTQPTSALNKMLRRALLERAPPSPRGEHPRVYYATQIGVSPPTVAVFVNDTHRFPASYVRYLENRFREYWDEPSGGGEVPVRVILRDRPRGGSRGN